MLAQCDPKLGAHICLCGHPFFLLPTHMLLCAHACPASELARRPVSLEPDVDGWTDAEEEQHSTSQGLALRPNKHTVIDGFLVSD